MTKVEELVIEWRDSKLAFGAIVDRMDESETDALYEAIRRAEAAEVALLVFAENEMEKR